MKHTIILLLIVSSVTVYGQNYNAVIPICPDDILPIVEIQINNTASNNDDYGSTAVYTSCSARVINFAANGNNNFPGGVAVEIRNPIHQSTNLVFSSSGTDQGSQSLFATLPEDGSSYSFYIKGKNTNSVDKTSIIEIATAGATCNDAVVARKALMITSGAPPIQAGLPSVEIEIGSVSTLDDYLTWAPKVCRIRWSNASSFPSFASTHQNPFKLASYIESSSTENTVTALNITLQNMSGTNRLRFAGDALTGGRTAIDATLPLTLSSDGSWSYFYMAGNFNNASINDKDAVMEVIDNTTGLLISREGVMVRIRKNANKLSNAEKTRFLEALKKTDVSYNDYIDFVKTHSRDVDGTTTAVASRQAHKGSAFLPWHRLFVLNLERLLQSADPSVTIPYWKFDVNAPNVFKSNFMGSNSTGDMVILASTNPIVSWTLPGENVPVGISRHTPFGDGGHPKVPTETATLGLGSPRFSFSSFKTMEQSFHDKAHSKSGTSTSWIITIPLAARDPLFFLLHCNVDRVWARWQWMRNRYNTTNTTDTITYDLLGSFYAPAPGVRTPSVTGNRTLGQYADDTVWPWDNITGGVVGSPAERPKIAILTPFPITLGGDLPGNNKPTVKSMIDYLGITNSSPSLNMAVGFDDFFPY